MIYVSAKKIINVTLIAALILAFQIIWANPTIDIGFPTDFDTYHEVISTEETPERVFENTRLDQVRNYGIYMQSGQYAERFANEIIIPIGTRNNEHLENLYQELSPKEVDLFFQNKYGLLKNIADKAVKLSESKFSMGKLTNERINNILQKVNSKLFTKVKEVSGDRAITINGNIFASAGANLIPETLIKQIQKINGLERLNPKLGFFVYLGVGGSIRKVTRDDTKSTEFTPTVDIRYGKKIKSIFLNLESGINITVALEGAEQKTVQRSELALRPPLFEYFPSGDFIGANVSKIPVLFVPLTSTLIFVDGQALRINVKQILPKAISKAKEVVKPKIEKGINFCRNLF